MQEKAVWQTSGANPRAAAPLGTAVEFASATVGVARIVRADAARPMVQRINNKQQSCDGRGGGAAPRLTCNEPNLASD
jgi:hypothetical protein